MKIRLCKVWNRNFSRTILGTRAQVFLESCHGILDIEVDQVFCALGPRIVLLVCIFHTLSDTPSSNLLCCELRIVFMMQAGCPLITRVAGGVGDPCGQWYRTGFYV